jgi:hypothetical protein
MEAFFTQEDLIISLITLLVVAACVVIHLEVLTATRRHIVHISGTRPRMILLVSAILLAHLIEICVFGLGYYLSGYLTEDSVLIGYDSYHLKDYFYYSASVYSTLGFGDLVPTGGLRIMTGIESMTGLVLITWSASFTFLEMQRRWED